MEQAITNPQITLQQWLYYRAFGEAYNQLPPPITESELVIAKLRELQKIIFAERVQIANMPDRLDNPPQLLKDILQQRIAANPKLVAQSRHLSRTDFARAIWHGVIAALVFLTILGVVFLVKSKR